MASTSTIISAMNKSLHFKDLFEKPIGDTFTVGSFDNCGYYKITITSQETTVILEFSQGRIISSQSVSSYEGTFKVKLAIDNFASNAAAILYVSDLVKTNNDIFSLNIEYNGGEFRLAPSNSDVSLDDIPNTIDYKKFSLNSTEFGISLLTSDISSSEITVETVSAESLYVNTLQFGDWKLSSDINTGAVILSLNTISES